MIEVCCALIFCNNELLAVQRGKGKNHPFQWEFPGGKVEDAETMDSCIAREIKEELQIIVDPLKKLQAVDYHYPKKHIRLIPFVCEITNTKIKLTEHIRFKWLKSSEIRNLNWQEADRELIDLNYKEILNLFRKNYKKGGENNSPSNH